MVFYYTVIKNIKKFCCLPFLFRLLFLLTNSVLIGYQLLLYSLTIDESPPVTK